MKKDVINTKKLVFSCRKQYYYGVINMNLCGVINENIILRRKENRVETQDISFFGK